MVAPTQTGSDLEAQISARCHGISKSEHVCAEVVRVSVPASAVDAVPGLLRANSIPGMQAEMLLLDSQVEPNLLEAIMPMCEVIYFDSSRFERRLDLVTQLAGGKWQLVDTQWLALGAWRDQVRAIYDKPAFNELLANLGEIEIAAQVEGAGDIVPASALLMAGWLIDRLNIKPVAYKAGVFDCRLQVKAPVSVRLRTMESSSPSRLSALSMLGRKGSGMSVYFERNDKLITTVELGGEKFKFSKALEDDSMPASLKHYFTIGESTLNYRRSLAQALQLTALMKRGS
ncbi:MAG: hypothetical protein DCC75_09400 [Proteobacteria bacterium]|nr:MAG: hypothetical protein DCC75_09400 [Pseudomonadota bacterium]